MVRYLHGIDLSKGQPCRLSDACFPQIFNLRAANRTEPEVFASPQSP